MLRMFIGCTTSCEQGSFGSTREAIMTELKNFGVETREAFIPYNLQEIFVKKGWVNGNECPIANYVAMNGFYLPSGPLLKKDEIKYIANKIKTIQRRSNQKCKSFRNYIC